ncbi:F5/8 type C domain protein [Poriferisphaera corsica]|uniref:F5/8 type C domain protein n=1 Tax=Poriferisphaera corsica TaxID=2528020 RepID=A0A517YRB2_9BACT|nr:discoidin domain-containing protein [Poriferisphaera corsica]QDU32768.1 F5/8 type C domain protein [Poriferisphaera corsica]
MAADDETWRIGEYMMYQVRLIVGVVLFACCVLMGRAWGGSAKWVTEASSTQVGENPSGVAVDGDMSTRWGSGFSDNQWLMIDLGEPTEIYGFVIFWEAAYATNYKIEVSVDKKNWEMAYETTKGDGNGDYVYIKPRTGRYCRITGVKRATGWGISIWEVMVLDESVKPRVEGDGMVEKLLDSDLESVWRADLSKGEAEVLVDLGQVFPVTGLRIDWAEGYAKRMVAESSLDGKAWRVIGEMDEGRGQLDYLLGELRDAQYLRMRFWDAQSEDGVIGVRELTLRGPGEEMTPMAAYQIAAMKAEAGYYPPSVSKQQVYWTVTGVPNDGEESLLDEYGNLEAKTRAPILMPYRVSEGKVYHAQNAAGIEQRLAKGHLPLPKVTWRHADVDMDIEAITAGAENKSTTYVRYRLTNKTERDLSGTLNLLLRPVQINPPWQHGGFAPIKKLGFVESVSGRQVILVNDEPVYVTLNGEPRFDAKVFRHGDIIERLLEDNKGESARQFEDKEGMLSAAVSYDYSLKPNQQIDYMIAVPLHEGSDIEGNEFTSAAFDLLKRGLIRDWEERLGRVEFSVNDREIMDTVKAQIAYILINQDGHAIQPGSRNYNRSWMRDGSITATAMMRMGLLEQAIDYINWYKRSGIAEDGLVNPILNTDGTVNDWFGADLEYDSQGQYLYLLMTYYRLTHDKQFLTENYETIRRVLKKTEELRLGTTSGSYMADVEHGDRFRGILLPSISHEGYSEPMHSYWDNFFALQGWEAGRFAAMEMGDQETADWALAQYGKLYEGLLRSITQTIEYKKISYLPASADLGDADPTSISIAFFPCNQQQLLPEAELAYTYDHYVRQIRERSEPGSSFTYTPYEVRNINALVAMGQVEAAHDLLKMLMNHRRPAGWRHLAEVVHSDVRKGSYIGDMPHTWVGSGFVHAVLNLVYYEADEALHLLPGTPVEWLRGDGVRLARVPTRFGELNMTAKYTEDRLVIRVEPLTHDVGLKHMTVDWQGEKPVDVKADGKRVSMSLDGRIMLPHDTREVVLMFEPSGE